MAFFMLNLIMRKSGTMGIRSAIGAWLDAESVSFTALCGESFSHGEVVKTILGTIAFLVVSVLAGGVA